MNRSEQNRLAREILQTDELADLRHSSLDEGLKALRGRNQQRRAVQLGACAAAPFLLALAVLVWRSTNFWSGQNLHPRTVASVPTAKPVGHGPIKFINDDELLSLLTNRPVALIGKPGHQALVFLDALVAAHQADERKFAGDTSN